MIGGSAYHNLIERRDEELDQVAVGEVAEAAIRHRLNEMLDAAREEGMSDGSGRPSVALTG